MLSANITSASVEFRSKPTCTALSKTDVESRRGGGGSVVFPLSRKCSTQVQVNEMSARGYHAAVIVSNKQLPLQHDDHSSLHIPAVYVTTATAHFLKRVNERINIQFTSAMLVPNTIVHGRETTTNTTTTTAAVWLNEHQLLRHAVAAYKAITTPRGKMKHIATLASMQDVVSLCAHSLFLEPRFADSYIVMSNTLHAMNRTTAANLTLTQWLSLLPTTHPPLHSVKGDYTPTVHVVTYASQYSPMLSLLNSSVVASGMKLHVLGLNDDVVYGHGLKITAMHKWIHSQSAPDVVLFVGT